MRRARWVVVLVAAFLLASVVPAGARSKVLIEVYDDNTYSLGQDGIYIWGSRLVPLGGLVARGEIRGDALVTAKFSLYYVGYVPDSKTILIRSTWEPKDDWNKLDLAVYWANQTLVVPLPEDGAAQGVPIAFMPDILGMEQATLQLQILGLDSGLRLKIAEPTEDSLILR